MILLEEEKVAPKKAREMRQKAREFFFGGKFLKGLEKLWLRFYCENK
jgi:hypothetical protein